MYLIQFIIFLAIALACDRNGPELSDIVKKDNNSADLRNFESISVSVNKDLLYEGNTYQFKATGLDAEEGEIDITNEVTWSSTDTNIAYRNGPEGAFKAGKPGSGQIVASYGESSVTTYIKILENKLEEVTLAPYNPAVPKGLSTRLRVMGTYSDGRTRDISSEFSWSTEDTNLAKMSNSFGEEGLVHGLDLGTTILSVSAVLGGKEFELSSSLLVSEGPAILETSSFDDTIQIPVGGYADINLALSNKGELSMSKIESSSLPAGWDIAESDCSRLAHNESCTQKIRIYQSSYGPSTEKYVLSFHDGFSLQNATVAIPVMGLEPPLVNFVSSATRDVLAFSILHNLPSSIEKVSAWYLASDLQNIGANCSEPLLANEECIYRIDKLLLGSSQDDLSVLLSLGNDIYFRASFDCDSGVCNEMLPCGGLVHGGSYKQRRYQAALVVYGDECKSEEQTISCNNGNLENSGTYKALTCHQNCQNGVKHGSSISKKFFKDKVVPWEGNCLEQIRTAYCDNGKLSQWTGSYSETTCKNADPVGCEGGYAHDHQQTRKRYESISVPFEASCKSQIQSRTCRNGSWTEWSGAFKEMNCSEASPRNCGTYKHGAKKSRIMYQADKADPCREETQYSTCYDGQWKAWTPNNYKFDSCQFNGCRPNPKYTANQAWCDSVCPLDTCTPYCEGLGC